MVPKDAVCVTVKPYAANPRRACAARMRRRAVRTYVQTVQPSRWSGLSRYDSTVYIIRQLLSGYDAC